jgi:K+-transporting ATPase c subunit
MIDERTEGRFLGIYGEPRVTVLELNLALWSAEATPPLSNAPE